MAGQQKKAPSGCYWRGPVLWGKVMVRGRRFQWSLNTDNPKVARERHEERKKRIVADMIHGDGERSYAEVLEIWGAHSQRIVAATTFKRYLCSLAQLGEHLDGRNLSDINGRLIGDIVQQRQHAGATNATIKRDLTALSSVMNYAVSRSWIQGNPVLPLMSLVKERRDPIVLPRDQDIELVISRGRESDRRPGAQAMGTWPELIRAAWVTGARLDELVTAKRDQFDVKRCEFTVIGKGNKRRVIDLAPFDGIAVFANLPRYLGCELLFWHDRGEPYRNASSNFANNLIGSTARFAETAGISFQPFRFHDLRHKHAVDWLQSGRSIYDLQRRLGHTSIKTTEVYLDFVKDSASDHERAAREGE